MSKIEQNKQAKQQAILSAAQRVFLSQGYTLANMDSIAREANVTKQTVYRYFPNKIELFQATLQRMGEESEGDFQQPLQQEDIKLALQDFARAFVTFHLSPVHLATYRLLVAESHKAPEIVAPFMTVGPSSTQLQLAQFFERRFGLIDCESLIQLWTGMLLSLRSSTAMGLVEVSEAMIEAHVNDACAFLWAALEKGAVFSSPK